MPMASNSNDIKRFSVYRFVLLKIKFIFLLVSATSDLFDVLSSVVSLIDIRVYLWFYRSQKDFSLFESLLLDL